MLTTDVTVVAQLARVTEDGWQSSRQVPTFTVPHGVHGLMSLGHAAVIAAEILAAQTPKGTEIILALSTPTSYGTATFIANGHGSADFPGQSDWHGPDA
jgi:hypothetical protein